MHMHGIDNVSTIHMTCNAVQDKQLHTHTLVGQVCMCVHMVCTYVNTAKGVCIHESTKRF